MKEIENLLELVKENYHKAKAYSHLIKIQAPATAPHLLLIQQDYENLLHELQDLITSSQTNESSPLSKREQEVLHLSSQGKLRKEIAYLLGISERTVQFHIKNATEKLGAESRVQAIAIALNKKFI